MPGRLLAAVVGALLALAPSAHAGPLLTASTGSVPGCAGVSDLELRPVGPPPCWRPYAPTSPWNRRIPAEPLLHPRSRAIARRIGSWGPPNPLAAGTAGTPQDFFHPVYFARPEDPVFTLHATRPWGRAEIEGHRIPVPDAARPAAGGDGHMAVITPDGWEYDLWTVQRKDRGGGSIVFGWGGRTRVDGDGLGSNATAARVGLAAGMIRASDLARGRIDHALFMGVRCTDSRQAAVYPASPRTAEPCTDLGLPNTDAPPMGARLQLDMTREEIDALPAPPWKKTILRALAEYGMVVGDRFGSGSWGLELESGATYTSFGRPDPTAELARAVGAAPWGRAFLLDVATGVDWRRLRVVHPCVSRGSC